MADTPGADDLIARLDALRDAGAAERDPVRFAYLEALSHRAAAQPASVQALLQPKLAALADELTRPAPPASIQPTPDDSSPLAALLQYIGQHAQPASSAPQPFPPASTVNPKNRPKSAIAPSPAAPELKAVAIFRDAWSKLSTEQQLTQTLAQAPENAGPMNSQHLVLRSLELMRDVAPAYLQGFMSYIDTLIWLEHADPSRNPNRSTNQRTGPAKPAAARKKSAPR